MKQTFFITGTDTCVGKTVVTALLTRFLRERGINVAALKPVCSGDRADARALRAAMNGVLTLDEINPWHFRSPIAPLLAARKENQRVKRAQVLAHTRMIQERFDILLMEGAGGLLSPLGENFDSRDLIAALPATPIIVAQNKLGMVSQVLLVLEALPKNLQVKARVILFSQPEPDASSASNAKLLAQFFPYGKISRLPWFGKNFSAAEVLKKPYVRRTLQGLLD